MAMYKERSLAPNCLLHRALKQSIRTSLHLQKTIMIVDLRSDTVTRPDAPMLEAMLHAPTGDDVFGEDPTVNQLQERMAAVFGHEAGLFCPSGTMTNQIAINVHTRPGDEVICDRLSHIYNYEGGGLARNSGVQVRLVHGDQGRFTVDEVHGEINPPDSHYARTSLISVEDTCNKGGGAVYHPEDLAALSEFARSKGLGFHLDGARVFNALAVTGMAADRYGRMFDSISVCLSKGLGTPGGSVLLGSREFIREAHRVRKAMGGGMRQVGILAAAGLYALDHRLPLLADDHEKAALLANSLEALPWVNQVLPVSTNIVIFSLKAPMNSAELTQTLANKGIFALPFGPDKVRFVTHYDVTTAHIAHAISVLQDLVF